MGFGVENIGRVQNVKLFRIRAQGAGAALRSISWLGLDLKTGPVPYGGMLYFFPGVGVWVAPSRVLSDKSFCRRVWHASCSFASSVLCRRRFHLSFPSFPTSHNADIYVLISSFLTSNIGDAKSDRTRVLSFGRRCRRRRRLIWKWKTCFDHEDWVHVSGDLDTRHEARGARISSSLRPLAPAP